MIKALIFDFDGLILDTEVPNYQTWSEIYQRYGCKLPISAWITGIGGGPHLFNPCEYLETQFGSPIDHEKILLKHRQRFIELVEAQPVLPGVEDYIAEAKRLGLKIGLASSSSHDWVDGNLSRLGLIEYFDCIKCSDDVKHVKPEPDLYISVLEDLGIRADEAIAFEDSTNGILSAKRAGIFCVAVPNAITNHLSLDGADLQITSLADLPLEKLLSEKSLC